MAFILDTSVVSELRKSTPDPNVLAWHRAQRHADVYLSTLVVWELRQGIETVRNRDVAQAGALDRWLRGLQSGYRDRILPVTVEITQEWERLNGQPQPPPAVEGLIAATAKVHQLTLVTGNVAGIAGTGVAAVNPFVPA